jgi:hypothetical protein
VNYWSHFGAIGDFRGLQVIDFVVPGARIARCSPRSGSLPSWQHSPRVLAPELREKGPGHGP